MKPVYAFLVGCLFAASCVQAQTPPKRASLAGKVTKDPTGEPVKKVVVELIGDNRNETGNYTAITGQEGDFRIENILPGHYRLFVERTGFLESDKRHKPAGPRWLTLAAGQEINDLLIPMQASVAITGRVTDEDGDPIPNAQVNAGHQSFNGVRGRWAQDGGSATDDLGNYRIANLAPGTYFVSVTPPPSTRNMLESTGRNATSDADVTGATPRAPEPVYETTFYPNARERSQASPVQLRAGEEMPVNFSLTPVPSLIVRGTVTSVPVGSNATVFLQSMDGGVAMAGAEVHKDGSFEIRGVTPGSYSIAAVTQVGETVMRAVQKLEVGSADMNGVRLVPQPGAIVRGRVRMEGKSNAASKEQLSLGLHPAEDEDTGQTFTIAGPSNFSSPLAADGSFEWKDVAPGRYEIQANDGDATEWFVKSLGVGGRDSADNSFIVNGGVITLDVVISANSATVEGVVTNNKNEVVPNAAVVVVPAERLRKHSDQFRRSDTDQSGHFVLRGLKPGTYTIFAWDSIEGEPYYNPVFMSQYEGQGKAIELKESSRSVVQLDVIESAE